MSTQSVEFRNQYGETLSGRLELPEAIEPRAFAVFAHCFTCGKAVTAAVRISRALAEEGIATLRFDFTGLDESEGAFGDEGFSANVRDLVSAAEFLTARHGAPQLLIGHSLGGTAAVQASRRIDSVRAVCAIAAPSEPSHALALFRDDIDTVRRKGRGKVELAGRRFTITKEFIEDFESTRMEDTLKNLGRALLVMHSPIDNVVGIEHAGRLFETAKHPKSFVSLDDADHMLGKSADAEYAARIIAAWASRYVDGAG